MTNKVTLNNLSLFDPSIILTVNSNNTAISTAMTNTLSRDGTFPNQMNAPLDMNSNRILNLPAPVNAVEPLRLQELINFTGGTGIVGPPGPPGINATFPTKASVQSASIPISILSIHVDGYTTAGDGGGALYKRVSSQPSHQGRIQSADGAWWELSENVVNPMMFGADSTGVADSSTAFQNCYDYNTTGVDVRLNTAHNYKISSPVILTHPGSISGARSASNSRFMITAGTASNDVFQVRSSFVNLKGLSINRPGSPSGTARAISIGEDTRVVTDMSGTNGSSTVTSATANFTSADIGKYLVCTGLGLQGPSFPITSIISSTQASVAPATATITASGQAGQIGFLYTDIVVEDCWIINHIVGTYVGTSQKCSFRNNRYFCLQPLVQNNLLWGDLGDHEYIGGTYQSTDDLAGIGFQIVSGGGAKLIGCKILGGVDALQIFWSAPSSSLGPFITGCSIEGGSTHGIHIIVPTFLLDGITVTGCEIGVAGTQIFIDNAFAGTLSHCVFSGNMVRATASNTCFSLGKITFSTFSGNTCVGGGLGTAYVLGTASANNVIDLGVNDTATAVTNAGTGNTIK